MEKCRISTRNTYLLLILIKGQYLYTKEPCTYIGEKEMRGIQSPLDRLMQQGNSQN